MQAGPGTFSPVFLRRKFLCAKLRPSFQQYEGVISTILPYTVQKFLT